MKPIGAVCLSASAILGCASSASEHSSGAGGGGGGNLQKPTYTEARPDDFETLPTNTEFNLGPIARPSDYPDAQGWKDPVPPNDCCEPVSEIFSVDPVSVNPATDDGTEGPPTVVWADSLWGVTWMRGGGVAFRTIDPDGLVVGPIERPFQSDGFQAGEPSMHWASDRFAVAYSSGEEGIFVGMLNRYGYAPLGSFASDLQLNGVVITRYTAYNAWLIAGRSLDPSGNSPDSLLVAAVDNGGRRTNDPVVNLGAASGKQAIVNLKNRADVVWTTPTGISSRSFAWPFDAATAGAEVKLFEGFVTEDYAVAAVAFRDSVVAAVTANRRVLTYSIDPWTDAILSGPHEIAAIEYPGGSALAIGAAENEGYLGVCYSRHSPGAMSLAFRLIGPDGRPWSRENVLTTSEKNVPSCSVAFNGESWSVAWWLAGSADNIVNVQLLRPTP